MTASGVAKTIQAVNGVAGIHDLHIWTVTPDYVALSAHVILEDQKLSDSENIMLELKKRLDNEYEIEHTTIQFECNSCGQGVASKVQ